VTDVFHIDRGYADFVHKLNEMGADMEDTGEPGKN
jgi:UDP-N-acetylglucosamine enolpyruvyl transferase